MLKIDCYLEQRLVRHGLFILACVGMFFSAAHAEPVKKSATPMKIEEIDANMKGEKAGSAIRWIDCEMLTIEGKGFLDTESFYDRLPARAKETADAKVWTLSQHSAGMAVRFTTSAKSISARWKLRSSSLSMAHMPATGKSGVDLYIKRDGKWRWIGAGKNMKFPVSEALLAKIPTGGTHEFLLYLPLYNGVEKVEIGVPLGVEVSAAPPRGKPIVFYGTSITQGGCASRAGMAFPAILGRWLDRPVVNLGFSGNGQMQPEVVRFFPEIDAEMFVIDCIPNLGGSASLGYIVERTVALVSLLRDAHPEIPILLVEGTPWSSWFLMTSSYASSGRALANAELKKAYEALVQMGMINVHYVPGKLLLGTDGEATVDGTHPTDLGMFRNAEVLLPYLKNSLNQCQ